ncbi:MAG TPA: ferritin-like domain-containing protein [Methylomirabilota bacterium]|nr:ferritin-like domain-containing protein [Methylomirabilota bacterium]
MKIGSEAHKRLFCGTFFDHHRPYEPAELGWPALDGETLALLRGLPFWTHALQAEEDAGPMISACAALEPDPMVRRALELQAFEEARHARIIRHMIERYALHADEIHVEVPDDAVEAFIDFGFEECLDSFGAFGLFKLAREHLLVPEALFEIFDRVMQEEASHIVFFLNWFAYRQARRGVLSRAFRQPKALQHYLRAVRKLAGLAFSKETDEGKDFIVTGADAFVDNLTPGVVLAACLEENTRRLAEFDRRLLAPRFAPRMARIALGIITRLPRRNGHRLAERR